MMPLLARPPLNPDETRWLACRRLWLVPVLGPAR